MNRRQRTAGWIIAALSVSQSLYAQTRTWSGPELREATFTVTLQQLRHAVPKEARAEMQKALKARRNNQPEQELAHLKRAVHIDPEYVAARNNLGVCLAPLDPASAIAQWEEAVKVDPRQGALFRNLAIVYTLINDLGAAERAARVSMQLERTSGLLGIVLYLRGKYTRETLALLELGADEPPMAHVYAASLLLQFGQPLKAKTHIQAYLSSGEQGHRDVASKLLQLIDRTGQPPSSSGNHSQIPGQEHPAPGLEQ